MTHTNPTINNSHQTKDEQPTPLNPQGYSRIKPTAELIGLHHQTLRRWWKADKFPKPINVNGIPMFRNSDILRFIENQQPVSEGV
ncbi:helix-turn-helix transcriptional regulator [Psychrobacter celer]|uniref:helix-turn-helix transcriptional regulator n=1 Tax=Psychrobacter celer TaxID=306572 RepID=UPI003FD30CDE|tara:strand:+ start:992 stop:1246 length:255 start_codon:yes stop_codon:yes gene_type:complete